MRQRNLRVAGAFVLALAAGCGGEAQPQRTPPANAKRLDPSTAGRISGRVRVEGLVPENPRIDPSSDPVCARENKDGLSIESVVVENGGLNNVFVYLKDGLGDYYFDTPTAPVRLDQDACRYTPHVFGVQTGQPIEIRNSDPTLHNVSAVPKVNRGFNFGQPMEGLTNTASFTAPEVMVRFKCDVHNWMSAYAGVLGHPYFAVTGGGGTFELKTVPPGTYTVEAWHEKFGAQTQTVTVAEKGSAELSFSFKSQSTNP